LRLAYAYWAKALATACILCAAIALVSTVKLAAAPDNARTLTLYNIHTKETTEVLYKKDGRFVPGALDKLNWALRDWRRDEKASIDPALLDLVWEIHAELGSKAPIHVISAYRSRATNDSLRSAGGGQANESRHILGQAMDVHFPDVPVKKLRYSALIRERGGVGYYPTGALPFVHVDTGRVRAWPRLPRYELALLFPNGRTQHQPDSGGPITIEDVRAAQAQHRDLAVQLASFHDERRAPKAPPVLVAVATPPPAAPRPVSARQVASLAPALLDPPRIVDRPSRLTAPTAAERNRLADLFKTASLTAAQTPVATAFAPAVEMPRLLAEPRPATRRTAPAITALAPEPAVAPARSKIDTTGWSSGFAQAPNFDDDHPEELAYRPFPIAPLMTASASADDPALVTLHHPEVARTLDLLDAEGTVPPMRLRPSFEVAALMISQQFRGEAVNLAAMGDRAAPSALAPRRVSTAAR
jgi:uncharacterized protein YcbK (DUF882 family)